MPSGPTLSPPRIFADPAMSADCRTFRTSVSVLPAVIAGVVISTGEQDATGFVTKLGVELS